MKKLTVGILCALALFGCYTGLAPYLGHWVGNFEVEQADKGASMELALKGYVQLYQTDGRFLMEIANPSQKVTLKGTWKMLSTSQRAGERATSTRPANGRFIQLEPHDISIEEPALASLKASKRPYLDPDMLRTTLSKPLIFQLSADGKGLDGLLTTLGPFLGRFRFIKGNTKIGATL